MKGLSTEEFARWNDEMVMKYHAEGTLFESKNFLLRHLEIMRLKNILNQAKIDKNDRVLDIGCGEGFLLLIMKKARKAVGMDISRKALEKAKNVLRDKQYIKLIWGNAEELKFDDNSFDKILSSEVLEHLPHPRKAMEEMHRVLDNKGLLVVCIPDEKRIQNIMRIIKVLRLNKFLHAARKEEGYEWHLHYSDIAFLKKISKGLFRIVRVERTPPVFGYRFVASLKKI